MKKVVIYSITFITIIVMLLLFYYSLQETIVNFFFENDPGQREKITAASGEQSQIMIDLANKQLAKQQQEQEIRKDESKNQSLFKELSANKATIKSKVIDDKNLPDEAVVVDTSVAKTDQIPKIKQDNQVQNGFVVVDCKTGAVTACPHYDVQTGTSPLYYHKEQAVFLVGRCPDVSIDVKTFCP